jgi:RNA polymerase sigma-70 factor (ECF subfamily)
MPTTEPDAPAEPRAGSPRFATTHWSVVLGAGGSDPDLAHDALATLCRAYWPPLYAYVRRRGHPVHDAQDLTQAFFARLLELGWVRRADPGKGRFRTFLLTALQRFLADEWDRARALKRGGAQTLVSLEALETEYQAFASTALSADRLYDRQWALALLDCTLDRLAAEFARAGRQAEFERLKPFLTTDRQDLRYAEVALAAGMSEGAARVAVHRLRRRYRELFSDEIAQTVAAPGEVEAELRHLMQSLATE